MHIFFFACGGHHSFFNLLISYSITTILLYYSTVAHLNFVVPPYKVDAPLVNNLILKTAKQGSS